MPSRSYKRPKNNDLLLGTFANNYFLLFLRAVGATVPWCHRGGTSNFWRFRLCTASSPNHSSTSAPHSQGGVCCQLFRLEPFLPTLPTNGRVCNSRRYFVTYIKKTRCFVFFTSVLASQDLSGQLLS